MRLPRLVVRSILLCTATLAFAATVARAAHVFPILPLSSFSDHSHENFPPQLFPAANLTGISFAFANLSGCTFAPGTNLTGADFTGANLQNANLSGCIIDNARFRGANLTNAALGCGVAADFRGAILTGTFAGACPVACGSPTPNLRDACTVGDVVPLCLVPAAFRGVVSGVVFTDLNTNGVLDLGEPGIAGVPVIVTDANGVFPMNTDGRGAYLHVSLAPAPATVQLGPLPVGMVPTGPVSWNLNLADCRSGQQRNFSAVDVATPTVRSTFGRVKSLYR